MFVLLCKSLILVTCAILIRSALPRYRVDQLIGLNWKYYLFIIISFLFLLLTLIILIS